jgi:hypothetical protein
MKKILSLLVVSLLLSGNAYADEPRVWFKDANTIHIAHKIHMIKSQTKDLKKIAEKHCKSHNKYYFFLNESRPISEHYNSKIKNEYKGGWVYEVFCSATAMTSAPLQSFATGSSIKYTNYVGSSSSQKTTSSSNSQSLTLSTDDKITQSKQICRDLGFKTNTEKFADCALKMMSIQFEATNKVASGSGTTQEIIVKHQNDYDIFDAMIDMSNAMLSNNKKSSSSSNNRGTNCVIGRTNPTFGTTTMNCN